MNHSIMNHSMMDHSMMNHSLMNASGFTPTTTSFLQALMTTMTVHQMHNHKSPSKITTPFPKHDHLPKDHSHFQPLISPNLPNINDHPVHDHNSHSSHGHDSPSAHGHDSPSAHGHDSPSAHGHDSPSAHGHDSPSAHGHDSPSAHDHSKHRVGNYLEHNMQMYFTAGVEVTILFKQWHVTTVGGLIGSAIGIFILAMLYEGLKFFREHLYRRNASTIQYATVAVTGQSGSSGVTEIQKVTRNKMMSFPHLIQTLLHVVQFVISYFLMLMFMTYNVWVCIAIALGAGAGFFLFGWKKATVVDVTEHCH
ncbi:high affinity copper uptake protein 1-like isoform X2 [Limulus polyphemus]|uniref:Copper transport protein n=1 Tax=Limulus polyphemus TaxID=6850 RepID=A0ABM1S6R1_LIMPO|nr:high affinity copper uptake protein 1-like isoform X2 [Limulus polyphemus]